MKYRYKVHFIIPSENRYAFQSTRFKFIAYLILWRLKKKGYKDAYIEKIDPFKEKCIEKYGWNFGIKMDKVNKGIPIGNLKETIEFLDMIEEMKNN